MTNEQRNLEERELQLAGGKLGKDVSFDDQSMMINDGSSIFRKGDVFTVPVDWEEAKFQVYIGAAARNPELQKDSKPAKGVEVDMADGTSRRLFIGTFKKSVMPYDIDGEVPKRKTNADGTPVPNVSTKGTIMAYFKKSNKPEEFFEAIKGKKFTITDSELVPTMRFSNGGTRRPGNQAVYTIDEVK